MPEYPLVPSYELPPDFQTVWDDITKTAWKPQQADHVVVFAGLHDPDIINISLPRWKTALRGYQHRFIAGIHTTDGQTAMGEVEMMEPGWATWQIKAGMTPEQAVWTVDQLIQSEADLVALYVWRGHATRAVMTLVKAAMVAGWKGLIYPHLWHPGSGPLTLAGFDNTPTHDELVPGEKMRLVNYTQNGHVAPPADWIQFRPAA